MNIFHFSFKLRYFHVIYGRELCCILIKYKEDIHRFIGENTGTFILEQLKVRKVYVIS